MSTLLRSSERESVILLIGANGQLGRELSTSLRPHGTLVRCVRRRSRQPIDSEAILLDIASADQISAVVREVHPSLIVNAAAYTAVDDAERDEAVAMQVNGIGTGILGDEAVRIGAALIHYSTDYVFNGTRGESWKETDSPDPINVYGKSKLAGEDAILATGVPHLIVRTSWVYGATGRNFVRKVIALTLAGSELSIVDDQIGAPTSARFLAEATGTIVSQADGHPKAFLAERGGTVHAVCSGETSWFGVAREILDEVRRLGLAVSVPLIRPVSSVAYNSLARRPLNSRLNIEKLRSVYGVNPPDWRMELRDRLPEVFKTVATDSDYSSV